IEEIKKHGLSKKKAYGTVALIDSNVKETYPPIMMTKGDLYKEMNRVAGWTQAKSKKVMQKNYDDGYQTYPRTDAGEIPLYEYQYLRDKFNDFMQIIHEDGKYERYDMPENKAKKYLVKEGTDDAHYGIVQTEKLMDNTREVTDDQRLMYEVVVKHAMTMFIKPYQYVSNRLGVSVSGIPMIAQNNAMLSKGWKAILLPNKRKKRDTKKAQDPQQGMDYAKYLKKGDRLVV